MGMEISSGQPNINLGGNGMGGNRGPAFPMTGDQAPASSAQLQNSMNFNDLQDQNRDINNNVNNVYHDLASNISDKYGELQRDIAANAVTLANMQAQNQMCCCEIKQQIAGLNLDNEKRFNAIESKMDQNTIQQLRDQLYAQSQSIQDLKADMRMNGVFRMPQGYTYNAGPGPFQANPFPVPFGAGF